MYLVAIAWFYVVLMMAVAEAVSTQGTVLGAIITFVLYGLLPLSLVLYLMGTPSRRRARRAAQAQAEALSSAPNSPAPDSPTPDGSGHAAGAPVAAERKET